MKLVLFILIIVVIVIVTCIVALLLWNPLPPIGSCPDGYYQTSSDTCCKNPKYNIFSNTYSCGESCSIQKTCPKQGYCPLNMFEFGDKLCCQSVPNQWNGEKYTQCSSNVCSLDPSERQCKSKCPIGYVEHTDSTCCKL